MPSQPQRSITRRTALAGLAGGGVALAARGSMVNAQNDQADGPIDHPIVGAWNAVTPGGPAISIFSADGTVVMGLPVTQVGPNGVQFVSSAVGAWEPISGRGMHFTVAQLITDADGVFTSSVTVDGYPVVSEDGHSLLDDQSQGKITIRDAAGAIVEEMPTAGAPPVTGTRMAVGAPGFDKAPSPSTPTS